MARASFLSSSNHSVVAVAWQDRLCGRADAAGGSPTEHQTQLKGASPAGRRADRVVGSHRSYRHGMDTTRRRVLDPVDNSLDSRLARSCRSRGLRYGASLWLTVKSRSRRQGFVRRSPWSAPKPRARWNTTAKTADVHRRPAVAGCDQRPRNARANNGGLACAKSPYLA